MGIGLWRRGRAQFGGTNLGDERALWGLQQNQCPGTRIVAAAFSTTVWKLAESMDLRAAGAEAEQLTMASAVATMRRDAFIASWSRARVRRYTVFDANSRRTPSTSASVVAHEQTNRTAGRSGSGRWTA